MRPAPPAGGGRGRQAAVALSTPSRKNPTARLTTDSRRPSFPRENRRSSSYASAPLLASKKADVALMKSQHPLRCWKLLFGFTVADPVGRRSCAPLYGKKAMARTSKRGDAAQRRWVAGKNATAANVQAGARQRKRRRRGWLAKSAEIRRPSFSLRGRIAR